MPKLDYSKVMEPSFHIVYSKFLSRKERDITKHRFPIHNCKSAMKDVGPVGIYSGRLCVYEYICIAYICMYEHEYVSKTVCKF